MFEKKYKNVKEVIQNVKSVTVTTDCWTSINTDSFMATTVHFIGDNFEEKSVLLECCYLEESHTSVNLASKLRSAVHEWNLQHKILLAISDNASNIQKAIKDELHWKHFG